jgi:hypothetical protein
MKKSRFYISMGAALPHIHERLHCYMLHQLLDTLAYNAWKQNVDLWRSPPAGCKNGWVKAQAEPPGCLSSTPAAACQQPDTTKFF